VNTSRIVEKARDDSMKGRAWRRRGDGIGGASCGEIDPKGKMIRVE